MAKLRLVPGVIAYDVDLKSDSATVLFDLKKVSLQKIIEAVAEAGYQARVVKELNK